MPNTFAASVGAGSTVIVGVSTSSNQHASGVYFAGSAPGRFASLSFITSVGAGSTVMVSVGTGASSPFSGGASS